MTATGATTGPTNESARLIDAGAPPTRFARGWHCLGLADTFRDGAPHEVGAFGSKLVVFADSQGALHVLDGYCRHMGGDLTQGTVKGDEIACPFHDWRWGGDGKCKAIPYAKRIPLRARTRSWTTLDRNRPAVRLARPRGQPRPQGRCRPGSRRRPDGWTDWTWETLTIENAHCREIIDNVVDMAHFFYIHFAFPTYFKNVFEGARGHAVHELARPPGHGRRGVRRRGHAAHQRGVVLRAVVHDQLAHHDYKGIEVEVILVNCHYPTSATSFKLQYGLIVKKLEGLDDATADKIAKKYSDMFGEGFLQDVEIWKNKSAIQNPLLCEEDGPVYQLRRWYEQFYVDVADVTPEMTERFEFEVDTTHANESWEREVAENLERRVAEESDDGARAAKNTNPAGEAASEVTQESGASA